MFADISHIQKAQWYGRGLKSKFNGSSVPLEHFGFFLSMKRPTILFSTDTDVKLQQHKEALERYSELRRPSTILKQSSNNKDYILAFDLYCIKTTADTFKISELYDSSMYPSNKMMYYECLWDTN